ncbi:MAG: ATP-binding protein [Fusobacteriaceae bacterium]
MKFKKDSLIFKILLYNNLAIIITALSVGIFLMFVMVTYEERTLRTSFEEKNEMLSKTYISYILNLNKTIFQKSSDLNYSEIIQNEKNSKEKYEKIANRIRGELIKYDLGVFYSSSLALIGENGDVLAESADDRNRVELSLVKNKNFEKLVLHKRLENKHYYLDIINGRNYLRIYFPIYYSGEKHYIITTVPVSYQFINEIKKFISSDVGDKIFVIANGNYYAGDFSYASQDSILNSETDEKLQKTLDKYYYTEKKIDGSNYYIGFYKISGYSDGYKGLIGIAVSKEEFLNRKKNMIISITAIMILLCIVATTIFRNFFLKLLRPLIKLTEISKEISEGNYNCSLEIPRKELGEVKQLSNSFKGMLKEIRKSNEKMKEQNLKLKENILRMEAIERLLMGLHIESDMNLAVNTLLSAFTSEMGLGYSRAMYFRYSREGDCLLGEGSSVNNNLYSNKKELLEKVFEFQYLELDTLIRSIKIPYKNNNLISRTLKNRKVIFYNYKGYKYNLGNDLFKSLGINNFMIIPIYSVDRNYGCIVLDYFGKDKKITYEEYELITLLTMNISIRIQNKTLEEEKIDSEREHTITKLTERFLKNRDNSLDKTIDIIQKYKNGKRDLLQEVLELETIVLDIRKENTILKEYSNLEKENFELLDIETIFNEIIEENNESSIEAGVFLSLFINYTGKIYGNKKVLKKAFIELMRNSYYAVLKNGSSDKKINVIVSRDKKIDKIRIDIIDNGIGMTPGQLEKIYEPFSDFEGGKPGLGLSLVYRVIKEHRGVIKFSSKENEGTNVKITLNAYKEEI